MLFNKHVNPLVSPFASQLLAYLSNYVEIRIDAVKILYEHRRPFPRGAQDIGTWQVVWTATAVLAVVTNAGLVSSELRRGWQKQQRL